MASNENARSFSSPAWIDGLEWVGVERWEKALAFIRGLSQEDKIALVYDDDGDGVSAAAVTILGIERVRGRGPDIVQPFEKCSTYIDPQLPEKLKALGITKLITVDKTMDQMDGDFTARLEKVCPVLIIDHHKLYRDHDSPSLTMVKPQLVWNTESSSYPAGIFAYTLFSCVCDLSDKEWIPCVAIVSDNSYVRWKTFVDASLKKQQLPPVDKDPYEAAYGVMSRMIYATQILAPYQMPEFLDMIVDVTHPNVILDSGFKQLLNIVEEEVDSWLAHVKEHMEHYPELELHIARVNPRHAIKSLLINKISNEWYPNETVLLMQDLGRERVLISARRQDFKVPMNELMEKSILGLKNANGGGHIPAAAASIRFEDKEVFVENAKRLLATELKRKK